MTETAEEYVCPVCSGTGKVKKPKVITNDSRYREHPHRKLPFTHFCKECEQYVTISHLTNYGHKQFCFPLKEVVQ